MSQATEFYDRTFQTILEKHGNCAAANMDAKKALKDRELALYDKETELEKFADYIRERYTRIIAKPFTTPFGHCVMLVESKMVKEYSDWLKTKNFNEVL